MLFQKDDQDIFPDTYAVGVHGYIIIYSVASRSSFESAQTINMKILNECATNKVPRVLIGNKIDLGKER